MEKISYPHHLMQYPKIFGISIKYLFIQAGLISIGSVLTFVKLIEIEPTTIFIMCGVVTFLVGAVESFLQRDFFYFWSKKGDLAEKRGKKKEGKVISIYRITLPDLEQKTSLEIDDYRLSFLSVLNNLPLDQFYRIVSLEGRVYLITQDESFPFHYPKVKLEKIEDDLFSEKLQKKILKDDLAKIGSNYYQLINLYKIKTIDANFLQKISKDFVINFKRVSPKKVKLRLEQQRRIHYSNTRGKIRDIESEASYNQSEEILDNLLNNLTEVFQLEAWVLIRSLDLETLWDLNKKVCTEMINNGITPFTENVALSTLLKEIIHHKEPKLKRSHLMTSEMVFNLLPATEDHLYDQGSSFYSLGGNEIRFNLFDDANDSYCAIITGPQGSGKSMLANKLLKDEIDRGGAGLILDKGYSFKKLVNYYNGETFCQKINPMIYKNPYYLKEFIKSIVPTLTEKEEGRILSSIKKFPEGNFRELISFIEKDQNMELAPYFEEFWDFISSDQKEINQKLIYVDTSLYSTKFKGPLIIYLLEMFKHMEGRRLFIIDECWDLLKKHADFLIECFRTFRKLNASAIAITQLYDDFGKFSFAREIQDLSFHKFIYSQTVLSESLDSFDLEQIKNIRTIKRNYSELYYKSNRFRKIFRYYPTPLEYELFTSDYSDNQKINSFLKDHEKYLGFKESIDKWVGVKYV